MRTDKTPDLRGCKVLSVFHNCLSKTPLELPGLYLRFSVNSFVSCTDLPSSHLSTASCPMASSNKKATNFPPSVPLHYQKIPFYYLPICQPVIKEFSSAPCAAAVLQTKLPVMPPQLTRGRTENVNGVVSAIPPAVYLSSWPPARFSRSV